MTKHIAIVGAACRLPGGANTPDQFWSLLMSGADAIGEIPPDRWDVPLYHHADPGRPGRIYTKAGGFLPRVDEMDAEFFGISPREAEQIDPQQRLLLELAAEALDDAGLTRHGMAGSRTGVFIGISATDYSALQTSDPHAASAYTNAGGALSIAANRLSYFFDLHGPSLAVDTACSSSLVAVHLAVESLRRGEAEAALVGGVNIIISPGPSVGFAKASMLSPTGRCHSFDAAADGYVRSEGGVVLVLKLLEDAQRDGDRILGCVRASGVNSDGRTNGLSLPNGEAQAALLRSVYAEAGVSPDDICYLEAHGTGTPAGDPIECGAIGTVLGQHRRSGHSLPIGSVKSNVGHLEPASGLVGMLKCLLALRHGTIPANLHFDTPNPAIDLAALNLRVVTAPRPVVRDDGPALFGVNSFGFGGTNAHVIIEEHVAAAPAPGARSGTATLLLSAASRTALIARAAQFAEHLGTLTDETWPQVCATAAHRRSAHSYRLALHETGRAEAARRLRAFATTGNAHGVVSGRAAPGETKLAFVFSGNGSQWRGMGRQLLAADPVFRATVARIDQLLLGMGVPGVLDVLATSAALDRTDVAQPALFALQVGLVESLRARGLRAHAVVGHSVGEVAAAWCAGILNLEQAVRVIAVRSAAQQRRAGDGRMAALGLSPDAARAELAESEGWIELAGENSPTSVTLAGDGAALETLVARVAARGSFATMLDLDYAFHSRSMDPIRESLRADLAGLAPQTGNSTFISTVTGAPLDGAALDADYWWRNVRAPIHFRQAIAHLLATGHGAFLEIGPHPVLGRYVLECAKAAQAEPVVLASLRRDGDEVALRDDIMPRLFVAGAELDLARFVPNVGRAPLPPYPWQRSRFWTPARRLARPDGPEGGIEHPLLGRRTASADPAWSHELDFSTHAYLAHHRIGEVALFPAAGFLEMMLAAAKLGLNTTQVELEQIRIEQALVLTENAPAPLRLDLSREDGRIAIRSHNPERDPAWALHAAGRAFATGAPVALGRLDLNGLRTQFGAHIEGAALYAEAAARGLDYGPPFQTVAEAWGSGDEALARLRPQSAEAGIPGLQRFHPTMLDGCFQTMLAVPSLTAETASGWLPVGLRRLRLADGDAAIAWCLVRLTRRFGRSALFDLTLLAEDGTVIAELHDFRARQVELGGTSQARVPLLETTLLPAHDQNSADASLSSPASLREALQPLFQRQAAELERPRFYAEIRPRLDRLAATYAASALRTLGVGRERFSIEDVADSAITANQLRLVPRLLDMIVGHGLAAVDDEGWIWSTDPDELDPAAQWAELLALAPDHLAELLMLSRAGEQLAAVLTGALDPAAMMFGTGSTAPEQVYDTAPFSRLYNALLIDAVCQAVTALPAARRVRILEIGGGTGGLTAGLLEALPRDRIDYVFTDLSEAFFGRVEARLGAASGLTLRALDIARDPIAQGFEAESFDIVLAANALHAAPRIDATLAHARALLHPGGLLGLIETQPQPFLDLLFGTLDGWWAFAGDPKRADNALLPPDAWAACLRDAGLPDCAVLHDAPEGHTAENLVILAQRPPAHRVRHTHLPGRRWLLLVERNDGVGERLANELVMRGHYVTRVLPGDHFASHGQDWQVATTDAASFGALFRSLAVSAQLPDEIVLLWGAEPAAPPMAVQNLQSLAATALLAAIEAAGLPAEAGVTVCTRDATPFGSDPVDPAQGALSAFARVAINEFPDRAIRVLDLHRADTIDSGLLARTFESLTGSYEAVLTADGLLVPNLRRQAPALALDGAPFALVQRQPGNIDSLCLEEITPAAPGPDEVQVAVRAVALNFHDLAVVGGLLPDEALESGYVGERLGMDFAGIVTAVGASVRGLAPGDRVVGIAAGALASHVVTKADIVGPMPADLSFEAAAGLPCIFVTLVYALEDQARLRPGDTLLVHSAAGGIGLAALQIARRMGIEVIATAGSAEKRAFLHRLGVRHVFDSRSLAFVDDVLAATGGAGVDAVVNSLSGEALTRSLSVLKPFGHFIELGKRDFFANSRIGLRPFGDNITLHGIDLDQQLRLRPDVSARLLRRVLALAQQGEITPVPYRTYPLGRIGEAFRAMQRASHIGKLVIAFDDAPRAVERRVTPLVLDPNGVYVVTGGLGGFGLATAEWLAGQGARHLLLLSRRGAASPEAAPALARLAASGVDVMAEAVDVSDRAALAAALGRARASGRRIGGVVHAAMVLDDVAIRSLTPERFDKVLRPKLLGAWHLHELTREDPLDLFVLYSSATTVIGNPGQANYVAANGFLEALAWHRKQLGLPALAVAWGAIAEVGALARDTVLADAVAARTGITALPPAAALTALGRMLAEQRTCVVAANADWAALGDRLKLAATGRFAALADGRAAAATADGGNLRDLLAALPREEALAAVTELLKDELGRILRLPAARIDEDQMLNALGLDSLMVVELQLALERLQANIPAMRMMNATVRQLAGQLVGHVLGGSGPKPADDPIDTAEAAEIAAE